MTTKTNERTLIRYGNRSPIGFVDQTKGGFFRAYSYAAGMGTGPFDNFYDAETEVKKMNSDANADYWIGPDSPLETSQSCRCCGSDLSRHGHAPDCENFVNP